MFTIPIDGAEVECELNLGSAIDYELEFGSDMVADVNGRVAEGDSGFLKFDDEGKRLVAVDFSAVSWTTLVRILWVAAKTRNPGIGKFDAWASSVRGVDLMQARLLVAEEMDDCFFRNAPVEQAEEGRDQQ